MFLLKGLIETQCEEFLYLFSTVLFHDVIIHISMNHSWDFTSEYPTKCKLCALAKTLIWQSLSPGCEQIPLLGDLESQLVSQARDMVVILGRKIIIIYLLLKMFEI